jgi:hypothetical protein
MFCGEVLRALENNNTWPLYQGLEACEVKRRYSKYTISERTFLCFDKK